MFAGASDAAKNRAALARSCGTFIGIDVDTEVVTVVAARLARVERELGEARRDAPPKLGKARRKRVSAR